MHLDCFHLAARVVLNPPVAVHKNKNATEFTIAFFCFIRSSGYLPGAVKVPV